MEIGKWDMTADKVSHGTSSVPDGSGEVDSV